MFHVKQFAIYTGRVAANILNFLLAQVRTVRGGVTAGIATAQYAELKHLQLLVQ